MKYVSILLALAVLCLIAAPAIGVADAKGPVQNESQTGPADGNGAQLGNGPNGHQTGDQDGSGPARDGSCIAKVNGQNGARTGTQDGTPDRDRDGSCRT